MKIKNKILRQFQNFILYNSDKIFDEDDLAIIQYGMEVVYSLITKAFVFLIISLLLKCSKEFLYVFLIISIIRTTSFGFHANTEIGCYIISFAIIFGSIYISNSISFSFSFKLIMCILSIISIILFAPADTEKKPLINKATRIALKIITLCIAIIYTFFVFNNNGFMSNAILCVLMINSINISPILYILFKRRYRNYEQY